MADINCRNFKPNHPFPFFPILLLGYRIGEIIILRESTEQALRERFLDIHKLIVTEGGAPDAQQIHGDDHVLAFGVDRDFSDDNAFIFKGAGNLPAKFSMALFHKGILITLGGP